MSCVQGTVTYIAVPCRFAFADLCSIFRAIAQVLVGPASGEIFAISH